MVDFILNGLLFMLLLVTVFDAVASIGLTVWYERKKKKEIGPNSPINSEYG